MFDFYLFKGDPKITSSIFHLTKRRLKDLFYSTTFHLVKQTLKIYLTFQQTINKLHTPDNV